MSIKRTRPARLRPRPTLPNHSISPDHLARIAALSKNARTTWFSLLGVLLFVGITLLGFEHIDFYGYDRQTELPLIGVSVPTTFFFYTAPLLVAANYIYFHLYLIRLWDALGDAPARIDRAPLGRAIPPWLVTDAALWLRNLTQKDACADSRPLEGAAAVLNLTLTWGFGLIIVAMSWWLSAVARDWIMTGLSLAALTAMLVTALTSLNAFWDQMTKRRPRLAGSRAAIAGLIIGAALAGPTYFRTTGPAPWMYKQVERITSWNDDTQELEKTQVNFPIFANRETSFRDRFFTLAAIDLEGEALVERPADWLPYDLAIEDYRRDWCAREYEAGHDCSDFGEDEDRFNNEFWARQGTANATLKRPKWHGPGRNKPDLRGANLRSSFLLGLNISGAQMQGANLSRAQMQGANLSRAQMQNTRLRWSILTGNKNSPTLLRTSFAASTNNGGAAKDVDLSDAVFGPRLDWRNAFLDGSVIGKDKLLTAMGISDTPCHWIDDKLSDADFHSYWRGWVEKYPDPGIFDNWRTIAPAGYEDVTPILPPPGCEWATDPLPGMPE